jgi:hypothetical protein
MKMPVSRIVVFSLLCVGLVVLLLMRPEMVTNWILVRKLASEKDAHARLAVLNSTLTRDPSYWNPHYLKSSLRASTDIEQHFLADLIHERFGTNGVRELRSLASKTQSLSDQSNVLAVCAILETGKVNH